MDAEIFYDHMRFPFHRGIPEASHVKSTLSSKTCADEVTLYVSMEQNHIHDTWHEASGCLVCQASASFLCEWSEGMAIDACLGTTEKDYLALLGPLTPLRQQCALLAFRCLRKLLVGHHRMEIN